MKRYHFPQIASTNDYAKAHLSSFSRNEITVISADEQTAGRGRYQRIWQSPTGLNIYATFCFFMEPGRKDIGNIAQLLAISAAQMLEVEGFKPYLKWPNDLMIKGKKVGGVLCEVQTQADAVGVAAGIGINVNMPAAMLLEIGQPATSLKEESGKGFDLESLLFELQRLFKQNLAFFRTHGFASLSPELTRFMKPWEGQAIRFTYGGKMLEGIFQAVNEDGSLTIIYEGNPVIIQSGEIS